MYSLAASNSFKDTACLLTEIHPWMRHDQAALLIVYALDKYLAESEYTDLALLMKIECGILLQESEPNLRARLEDAYLMFDHS